MPASKKEIALITIDQPKRIIPYAGPRASVFLVPLNNAMTEFGIDTPARQAAFLAQVAHESGSLRYVREIADGSAYEDRADRGNTESGDGARFKGAGWSRLPVAQTIVHARRRSSAMMKPWCSILSFSRILSLHAVRRLGSGGRTA